MTESLNPTKFAGASFNTGPDLPWQLLKYRPPNPRMQFQFSRAFLSEDIEESLTQLAARLEAAFNTFFKTQGLH